MSHRPVVDLRRYPDPAQLVKLSVQTSKQDVITSGDMHGSIARLAHFLVSHGFWEIEEAAYLRLLQIGAEFSQNDFYRPENVGRIRELLAEFIKILDSSSFINNPGLLLRFIGDVFADRGPNDWLTLLIFESLVAAGINLRFTLGNHDYDFVIFIEKYRYHLTSWNCMPSLQHLSQLIKLEVIGHKDLVDLYKRVVAPHWELWGHDFNPETLESVGSLSVHAAALVPALFHAAHELRVARPAPMDRINRAQLGQLIDGVNDNLRSRAKQLQLLSPVSPLAVRKLSHALPPNKEKNYVQITPAEPFAHCTWNRCFNFTDYVETLDFLERLNLRVVLGHVGPRSKIPVGGLIGMQSGPRFLVLDTATGKGNTHMTGVIKVGFNGSALPSPNGGYNYKLIRFSSRRQQELEAEKVHIQRHQAYLTSFARVKKSVIAGQWQVAENYVGQIDAATITADNRKYLGWLLLQAIKAGKTDLANRLLPLRVDLGWCDAGNPDRGRRTYSALHFAVLQRDTDMVQALLRSGADPLQCFAGGISSYALLESLQPQARLLQQIKQIFDDHIASMISEQQEAIKTWFDETLSAAVDQLLPADAGRQQAVRSAWETYLSVLNNEHESRDAFVSDFQQATTTFLDVLCRDKTTTGRDWRRFKAVVVNTLLALTVVLTLGAAAYAFVDRKKKTGCGWFYGQTNSATRFFSLRKQLEGQVSTRFGMAVRAAA